MTGARRSALVVGVGGIGGPAAMALAAEGIAAIGLCDPDVVALDNLPRQVLFADADVGRRKVDAAAERLSALRPDLRVERFATAFTAADRGMLERYDVVLDGTDRLETKLLLHDAAVDARVPIAVGAALAFEGHALLVPAGGKPCYRCYFRDEPSRGAALTCSSEGVWPPLPGLVGALLSRLAIAYLLGNASQWSGRLHVIDAERSRFRERRVEPAADCPACGAGREARGTGTGGMTMPGDAKGETSRKIFLTFPQKLIKEPILYTVGQKFRVIPNIRGASVSDELGLIALELEGESAEIDKAVAYFQGLGVKVEPIQEGEKPRL